MVAHALPEHGSRSGGQPPPPSLAVYQPPSSEIWVATLPNWRRRFLIAGGMVVVGVGIIALVVR